MTNFEFLQSKNEFAAFASACAEAEKSIAASPSLCALGCRKSMELAVKWLYSADKNLKLPFNHNLSALIYNPFFAECLDDSLMGKLKYIIKLGNFAAHTNKNVTYREAVLSLGNLFDFIQFIDYCYGTDYIERTYDEVLLPAKADEQLSKSAFDKLSKDLDNKDFERGKLLEEVQKLQAEMAAIKAVNIETRTFTPKTATEAETRSSIIDIDIKSMGWTIDGLHGDCRTEVPVIGMPTNSGDGRVDYVLYGDNGKPLAVVEAKRTTRNPKEGKQQAKLYADCLEKSYDQRPLIFYTNGYDTWFWDDSNYPDRQVFSVFSKDDLQKIINRRNISKTFDKLDIKDEITDRPYQKIAIQRVCESFSKSRRKALLVMATGTGKTRTVVSLVDVLLNHRFITNVLFLADRKELVKQAKQAFNKHLPNLSTCNLIKREKDEKPTDRGIFSTYPTIMNAINEEKTEDGKKLFTPGHFDLIIVDEAHRSIFNKYRAIFSYFDALVVGLTATPKSEVEKNTYEFFDLETNMPTYAYEYDPAVSEKYLCDYHCIEKLFKIPIEGIIRDKLSEDEQQSIDDIFEEGEEVPDFISGDDINKIFLNADTCRKVLTEVMQKGLKVEGGDKLGKTIIFARNHDHAAFLEKQFNILYPQYHGKFARVIDYKSEERAESLLQDFKIKENYPQIAISVDMLDTGIDVPEVLNLVYFKRVMSKTKFWQMFGRGTRLCEDLFGPGEDKKEFYVFDYMGNFEYFRQSPKGKEATETGSLSEYAFRLKARIVHELQDLKYDEPQYTDFRTELVSDLSSQIALLNKEQFQVRANLKYVETYSDKMAFQCLNITDTESLIAHLAALVPTAEDEESARRLDILIYRFMLAKVTDDDRVKRVVVNKIKGIAGVLVTKGTLPDVQKNKDMLHQIQQDSFWDTASLQDLDEVRIKLRTLMYCLKSEMKTKEINITDSVIFEKEGQRFTADTALENYYRRADKYVKEHKDKPCLAKLRNNEILTREDWNDLETIFWQEIGTEEEFKKASNNFSLGRFARAITGLADEAVQTAFSEFLNEALYSEEQIQMVKYIIDSIKESGTLIADEMREAEFFGGLNPFEVWGHKGDMDNWRKVQSAIAHINENAERKAA